MDPSWVELLECPICHHQLDWHITSEYLDRIEQANARCSECGAEYPIVDGIGIFLTPDLPRNEMWEQVDNQLTDYLRVHPDLEKQLMDGPAEQLSGTDQQFRAMVLDARGRFAEGVQTEALARVNLYTSEYLLGWDSQVEYILNHLGTFDGPIVDLASGRCYLVEEIARHLRRPVIATDFSLSVLRRNRKYFQFLELDDLVSFLAFDARKTPFKSGVIDVMTTNVGLSNIENPGELLSELRRVIRGTLLAISHFYPEDDHVNRTAITQAGLEVFAYKQSALKHFVDAGWHVWIENAYTARATPTPASKIFEGARADGLPVAQTELEWCTLRAVGDLNG